jgi:arylsulfatase A
MAGKPGGKDGIPNRYSQAKIGLALYDLTADVGEQNDVAEKHPDVVKHIQALAEKMRADLGDANQKGKGMRQPGRL